jgi:mercuric ion transport protein
MNARRRLYASLAGTFLVALCCFTPILVVTLTAAGVAAFTPYLDLVLFPMLGVLTIVTWSSYKRYGQASPDDPNALD